MLVIYNKDDTVKVKLLKKPATNTPAQHKKKLIKESKAYLSSLTKNRFEMQVNRQITLIKFDFIVFNVNN
jgi:hypothetical protein